MSAGTYSPTPHITLGRGVVLTEGSGAVRRDGVETVYLSEPSVETVETAVLCWGCGAASFETVLVFGPGAHTGPRQRTRERVHLVKSSKYGCLLFMYRLDLHLLPHPSTSYV